MKPEELIRAFNRFYLPHMNLLGNNYLGSHYSVAQARIFYEIYIDEGVTARQLTDRLEIDKSFLSRILKNHEKNGLLRREVKENDARAYGLYLTDQGRKQAESLIELSNQDIRAMIHHLNDEQMTELLDAFKTIYRLLGEN